MNNSREGMLNNLVLAIISTQNEIKDAVKTVSAQVVEIKDNIKELRTAKEEYEERLFEMQQENTKLREQLESILANAAEPNRSRSVQHPVVEGTKNKRQFSWDLLRKLMEDVHGSPVDNVMFDAARDHITIFRLPALIREVKDKHQIENGKSFKDTDPRAKLAAIEALEEMAVPFIPLRACVVSWGASLMLRYYWSHNEKNRHFAASSNKHDQTPQENTIHGRGLCQPSSSASALREESDDRNISDIRPIAAASIFTSTVHHRKANDTNKCRSNNKGKRTAKRTKSGKSN